MGLIEKIKLLFKVRQPATDIINEVKTIKSGWKTIPFWIALIGSLLSFVAALTGVLPGNVSLIISAVLTLAYNVLRGATKTDVAGNSKPVVQTSEFWIGVGNSILTAIVTLKNGGINPAWFMSAQTLIAAAMAAGQNLAGQQPTQGIPPAETPTK